MGAWGSSCCPWCLQCSALIRGRYNIRRVLAVILEILRAQAKQNATLTHHCTPYYTFSPLRRRGTLATGSLSVLANLSVQFEGAHHLAGPDCASPRLAALRWASVLALPSLRLIVLTFLHMFLVASLFQALSSVRARDLEQSALLVFQDRLNFPSCPLWHPILSYRIARITSHRIASH